MASLLASVAPLLEMSSLAHQELTLRYLTLHKATAKLSYIASSLLGGVIQEGFCTVREGEEAEGASGEGAFKEAEGTGMGEGEGKKDVSDQLEDEDQLLGAKRADQPEEKVRVCKREVEGIEMEAMLCSLKI